jgi:hypothetical protein
MSKPWSLGETRLDESHLGDGKEEPQPEPEPEPDQESRETPRAIPIPRKRLPLFRRALRYVRFLPLRLHWKLKMAKLKREERSGQNGRQDKDRVD